MTPSDRDRLLGELRPGLSVFVQGATGEPQGLIAALQSDPERARGVSFTAPLIPGVNGFDYAGLHPEAGLTSFMAAETLRASIDAGRARIIPLCYSQIAKAIALAAYDVAVLQLTPPDADGRCSFGVSADFGPLAWRRAGRRIGVINPAMAAPPRSQTIAYSALDLAVEDDSPLIATTEAAPSAVLAAIAAHVASLIPDGAALQTGVGGAPAATLAQLTDRRDLVIRSGMVTEGYRTLSEAGALARSSQHVTGIAYGSADFYAWLADTDLTAFASVKHTHGAAELAETPHFMAINSALEVDLYGQANLEWRGGRAISGVGGAQDFARGAAASQGGRAIIALPSTAKAVSRITPRLTSPTVSLARNDVDMVVTEHGIAELRGKTLEERAEALIAIADPAHQGALTDAWRDLR